MMIPDYDWVAAGFFIDKGKIFVARRLETSSIPLKWEFPGGTVETDESYDTALIREFKEEFELDIEVIREVGSAETKSGEKVLIVFFFLVKLVKGDYGSIKLKEHKEVKFVTLEELKTLDLCPADEEFIFNFEEDLKSLLKN